MKLSIQPHALIASLLFLVNCQAPDSATTPPNLGWQKVYAHDEKGNPTFGSITALINGIRAGHDVRVGWGWQRAVADSTLRLEHMAEPLFLSIIQEKMVSVVIDGHPMLQSYVDMSNQNFRTPMQLWQCVMTTKGTFNAKVFDVSNTEMIRDMPQRQRITWFLEYPAQPTKMAPALYE